MSIRSKLRSFKSAIAVNLNVPYLYKLSSYSQEGEDRMLSKYFHSENRGFYVDVGAHHPFRYSNTYLLYKKGWRGINIDPNTKSFEAFTKARPEDINIKAAVGRKRKLVFYCFEDSALNTCDKKRAQEVEKSSQSKLIGKRFVTTTPLSEILKKHASKKRIDFLNIDVEGFEEDVLRSNDWKRFYPRVICIEVVNVFSLFPTFNTFTIKFLLKKGYKILSLTQNSVILTR